MIRKILSSSYDGQDFGVYRIVSGAYSMTVAGLGATIMTLNVPDKNGAVSDIVLGYDDPLTYMKEGGYFYGALIGRVGNRVKDAKLQIDGKEFALVMNQKNTSLHGGKPGFHTKVFQAEAGEYDGREALILTASSPDGEGGYPGDLYMRVVYYLSETGDLGINYQATTTKPTAVNLTNHSYFNLSGHGSGDILDHELWIDAPWYTPTDADFNTTGEIASVTGTPLDFTAKRRIGDRIDAPVKLIKDALGYDHNFVLKTGGDVKLCARVTDPKSGRIMEVLTDCPGIQLYTSNFITTDEGKGGAVYKKRDALCLETQDFPGSVGFAHFNGTVLRPGQVYDRTTIYRFSAQ